MRKREPDLLEGLEPEHPAFRRPLNALSRPESSRTSAVSGRDEDFVASKHRTRLRAEQDAAAKRERRRWAHGKEIAKAYEEAMAAKKGR